MAKNEPLTWEDAKALQAMPLDEKVGLTTWGKIYEWTQAWDGNVYVSFSGGKDSTVLSYLVCKLFSEAATMPKTVQLAFSDTGLEYPEIRKFVKFFALKWLPQRFPSLEIDLQILRPKMRFDNVIQAYGYPIISKKISKAIHQAKRNPNGYRAKCLRGTYLNKNGDKSIFNCEKWAFLLDAPFDVGDNCCMVMKKSPIDRYGTVSKKVPITATMADEGLQRLFSWMKTGCNAYESRNHISKPMSFWTEQDVLRYIQREGIPICSVYGDIVSSDGENDYDQTLIPMPLHCTGCKRTGCIFCGYGAHLEKHPNRFERLKETHPAQYRYCIGGGAFDPADGLWKPDEHGLGMARVLDFIGVSY